MENLQALPAAEIAAGIYLEMTSDKSGSRSHFIANMRITKDRGLIEGTPDSTRQFFFKSVLVRGVSSHLNWGLWGQRSKYYQNLTPDVQKAIRDEIYKLGRAEFEEILKEPVLCHKDELDEAQRLLESMGYRVELPKIQKGILCQYCGWNESDYTIGDSYLVDRVRGNYVYIWSNNGVKRFTGEEFRNTFLIRSRHEKTRFKPALAA